VTISKRGSALAVAILALAAVAALWLLRPARRTFAGANVLLMTLDTLRADRLGSYGHTAAETPRLDRLAAEGIRFEQAISPMPMTLPSHTSIMTALEPYRHGVRDNADFEIAAETPLLAELFRDAGYDTGAFVAAYVLHSRWGLSRGFERYDDTGVSGVDELVEGRSERRGDEVVAAALPWLTETRPRPFFGWVHLYDPHAPYAAPEPYGRRFASSPYDGEVAFTDSVVGALLDGLLAADLLDNTIVVVAADHGEGLQDHDEPGHGLFVYDATVRVPLIVRLPGARLAGKTVTPQVRLIDIAPTLLELAGIETPATFQGLSLAPHLFGAGEARAAYSETMYPRWHFGWQELHALRRDGYKYILAPRDELYDLGADPGERRNLADDLPRLAEAMREDLGERLADVDSSQRSEVTAEAARRLRALGYIGTAPTELGDGPLPDPKDKIDVYGLLVDADSLAGEGAWADAEELLLQIIARDPRVVDAHYELGTARLMQQDYGGAEAAFLEALALRPDYEPALADLGVTHRRMGEIDKARADFTAVLDIDPRNTNALFNLGELDLEAGDPAAALRRFDRVIATYDDAAAPRFAAGAAAYELGQIDRADAELERVAAIAPEFASVHYYRALVREARGDLDGAVEMYRRAIQQNPDYFQALFNMSRIFIDQRGDHAAGVQALRRAIRANPDLERAHIYLGRSLVFLADPGDYPEAESALLRGLALQPPPGLLPMAHHTLAELYRRTGRPAEAERQLALARESERAVQR